MSALARVGFGIAALAALAAAVSGPGYRLDLWSLGFGFSVLRWSVYAALAGAALSGIGVVAARVTAKPGRAIGLLGVALGAVVFAVPYAQLRTARTVPPIHDVSTDTLDPPQFVAVLPLRSDAPNPAAYGGAEVAAQQARAYPDLQTRRYDLPPQALGERALAVASELGWEIVAQELAEGRIEASDTTFWYGFVDDVVIRIRPDGVGSRLDARSVSRVGRGDVGANAARLRAFFAQLDARTAPR